MKCLLKSGDTKKVLYYAGVSRNREIYVLAANYLQTLDWHSDPEIVKNIVAFYTKAKALEQLSGFYDACAQVEIDEYRDYEKALEALKKAATYMVKARTPDKEHLLANLQQRIYHIEQFVTARLNAKDDPAAMVRICHALLGLLFAASIGYPAILPLGLVAWGPDRRDMCSPMVTRVSNSWEGINGQ